MLKEYSPPRPLSDMISLQPAFSFQDGTWFGVLVDNKDRLIACAFSDEKGTVERNLSDYSERTMGKHRGMSEHRYLEEMIRIFRGQEPQSRVQFGREQNTSFQTKVYAVLDRIPRGRVTNYGLIAKAIDSGPRAVGQAVGSNPYPLFVPCHRVVPVDMTVGNYSMSRAPRHSRPDVKKGLLEREGIPFQGERILPGALWTPG